MAFQKKKKPLEYERYQIYLNPEDKLQADFKVIAEKSRRKISKFISILVYEWIKTYNVNLDELSDNDITDFVNLYMNNLQPATMKRYVSNSGRFPYLCFFLSPEDNCFHLKKELSGETEKIYIKETRNNEEEENKTEIMSEDDIEDMQDSLSVNWNIKA